MRYLLCVGWVLHGTGLAQAQAYPNRPIRMVVPFPAGGPTDNMARIIADRLGAVLHQTIVVENRGGGAGGSIGAKAVATADPDGYTLLITPGGALTTGPAVHSNIGYDPVKVFAPVCEVMETPQVLAVHESVPVKSMAELVAYAKANPGKLTWGSQGFGTAPHLLAELFKLDAGVNILHVPYRGTAPMLAAILANEVQIVADPMTTILPHIQSGKLRALAVTVAKRSPKAAGCPDRDRGRLSPVGIGVLAGSRGAGWNTAGDHRQAQCRVPRKPCVAGNPRVARQARGRGQGRNAGGVQKAARR